MVEDQPLIALSLCDALRELGLEPVGPAHTLTEALQLATSETLDAALVDIWLGNVPCYSAADILFGRSIPFLIVGGASSASVRARGVISRCR